MFSTWGGRPDRRALRSSMGARRRRNAKSPPPRETGPRSYKDVEQLLLSESASPLASPGRVRTRTNLRVYDPPQGHFRFAVCESTEILTRDGFVPIADLGTEPVEVWTGAGWAKGCAHVSSRNHTKFRVTTSSGLVVECDKDQSWPLLGKGLEVSSTSDLCMGDRLFPFTLPKSDFSEGSAAHKAIVRGVGTKMAEEMVASSTFNGDSSVLQYFDAPTFIMFLSAYALRLGGRIRGPKNLILKIQKILLKFGVGPCQTTSWETKTELLLNKKWKRIFPREDVQDLRCFTASSLPITVKSVERIGKSRTFYLCLQPIQDGNPHTRNHPHSVIAGGVLLLAPCICSVRELAESLSSESGSSIESSGSRRSAAHSPEECRIAINSGQQHLHNPPAPASSEDTQSGNTVLAPEVHESGSPPPVVEEIGSVDTLGSGPSTESEESFHSAVGSPPRRGASQVQVSLV